MLVPGSYDGDDSADAYWRSQSETTSCVKTCIVYSQLLGGDNPHIVRYVHHCAQPTPAKSHLARFLRRDPWTGLPVLARPAGPPLAAFLATHAHTLYPGATATSNIAPRFRPLICQWALQLLAALSFVHSRGVILVDLGVHACWLGRTTTTDGGDDGDNNNDALPVAVAGFAGAAFRDENEVVYAERGRRPGGLGGVGGRVDGGEAVGAGRGG